MLEKGHKKFSHQVQREKRAEKRIFWKEKNELSLPYAMLRKQSKANHEHDHFVA